MDLLWNVLSKNPHDNYIANVLFHLTGKRKVKFDWNWIPNRITVWQWHAISNQQSSHTLTRKSSAKNQHSIISPSCHCKPTCFSFFSSL